VLCVSVFSADLVPEIKDVDLISIAESITNNLGGRSIICSAVAETGRRNIGRRDGWMRSRVG